MENSIKNQKSLKKSIKRLSSKLQEKGYYIQHSALLEGVASFMGYKDWNTLVSKTPDKNHDLHECTDIKNIKKKHIKKFQIDIDDNIESVISMMESAFKKANATLLITNSESIGNKKIITLDCTKSSDNVITAMIYFVRDIQRKGIEVKEMLISRETQEVEDLSDLMKIKR